MKISDNLNDLEGDIRNLSTLINTIVDVTCEADPNRETMQQVQNLLWIARDLGERLIETASACHHKVMDESKAAD
jgi:ABC-type transporter Mla subunit MlaD